MFNGNIFLWLSYLIIYYVLSVLGTRINIILIIYEIWKIIDLLLYD
jgi:hypothetical protein